MTVTDPETLATTFRRSGSGEMTFEHDPLDRLISASGPWGEQAFTYDAVGNRTAQSGTFSGEIAYTYGPTSHRLLGETGSVDHAYRYDQAGNLVRDEYPAGRVTYAYDDAGRMKTVRRDGEVVATYAYNAVGQRVKKAGSAAGGTRLFVYADGGKLLGEYDATGRLVNEYVWLDDLPVAVLKPKAGSTTSPVETVLYHVYADHLGTPRQIVHAANHKVLSTWDGAPFGETLPNEDADANGSLFRFNLRFLGQYYDAETGHHYNSFRDYEPGTGRYIESDPIGLGGGVSPHVYVENDPLNQSDPLGLMGSGVGSITQNPTSPQGGQCDGTCPNPVTITWTSGLPNAPVNTPATKTYSGKCLLQFGLGFKGSMFAAGTAAQEYGPPVVEKAPGTMAGKVTQGVAIAVGSVPGTAIGLSLSISALLGHCE